MKSPLTKGFFSISIDMHHIILLFTSFFSDFFMQKKNCGVKRKNGDRFKIRITYEYMRTLLHSRLIPDDPSWHNYQKRPKNQRRMTIATILPFSCPFLLFFLITFTFLYIEQSNQSLIRAEMCQFTMLRVIYQAFGAIFTKMLAFPSYMVPISFTTSQK